MPQNERTLARGVVFNTPLSMLLLLVNAVGCASSPPPLSAADQNAVTSALETKGLSAPKSLEVNSAGFVVADCELTEDEVREVRSFREFGEARLLAIREELLPSGYKDYRVNVNGPPPGTGLIRRYGSARLMAIDGRLEWLTP